MAKVKYTGAGAMVSVDVADDGSFVDVGCSTSITPPPQQLADIDVTCQQDTAADSEPGIEQVSQANFVEPYDYVATKTLIDDFYDSRATKDWKFTFTKGADSQVIAFSGYVSALVPNAAGGNDPLTRTVTITRTSAISYNPV